MMTWIDWLIVLIPIAALIWVSFYSSRYARSVADFLAAGRVAGRYVISVADIAGAISIIYILAGVEENCRSGFALVFWGQLVTPIGLFMSLTGFCVYRWRQTRVLSLGQFIELRYGSKVFRVVCAVLRTVAEMIANSISPAIAANFFIYFLGLPHKVMICGINLPCYTILVGMCLLLSLLFVLPSGRISLLITDAVQGILSYPIFVLIVGYIILHFSWGEDICPIMWNRVPGQSFMNPYDIYALRDFNVFATMVSLLGGILNRAGWIGNDTTGSGKTPHEQKMAGVVGAWKAGLAYFIVIALAMLTITFMNNQKFSVKNGRFSVTNVEIRQELAEKILENRTIVPDKATQDKVMKNLQSVPATYTQADWDAPDSQQHNPNTPYLESVKASLGDTPEGRSQYQQFSSIFSQMMMPTVLRHLLPVGVFGLFLLLMIMLLISTDDSRIFNSSATLMQDVVLPIFKGHLDHKTHLFLLRLVNILVAIFFFCVALLFRQMDYIKMFTTVVCSFWLGGAAPIMLFGLYSRFGNLTGAWCAIIFGSGSSILSFVFQQNWTKYVYPFCERMGWVEGMDHFLRLVSSPFGSYVQWSMDPYKYPINSFEIYAISMALSIGTYVLGSYLTYKPYNLDKLLHRGKYADGPEPPKVKWSWRTVFSKIIGITPEYSRFDRVIAYGVVVYSIGWGFITCFLTVVIWNAIYPWPAHWWKIFFLIQTILVPLAVGIISTFWFMGGGIRDSIRLFRDLEKRKVDENDNGQVFEKIR